jgi:hypothetical protein
MGHQPRQRQKDTSPSIHLDNRRLPAPKQSPFANHPARLNPATTNRAINSDRFSPFFLAPCPIFGRPRRNVRSRVHSRGVIGRRYSNAKGSSNCLVASANSAVVMSSGCSIAFFIVFPCGILSTDRVYQCPRRGARGIITGLLRLATLHI